MKTRLVLAILIFAGITTGVACSSSDNNGGGGGTDAGTNDTDSGSGNDLDSGGTQVTFDEVYSILENNCIGCHKAADAGTPSGKLSLTPKEDAWNNLVDKRAQGPGCASFDGGNGNPPWRVRSGNVAKSLLISKLGATPECGAHMPKSTSGKSLTQNEINTIRQWIAQGAHE